MVKVAVVGAGYWGKNLLRVFQELGALHAICERDTDNPNLNPYKGIKLYTDYVDLLSDTEVKAVAIATPAVTHYEMARKALEFGKDVYVEKPLALTGREGQELVDIADRERKILMVGHILRYHSAVIKLKELVSSGTLGKVEYIYSNRLNQTLVKRGATIGANATIVCGVNIGKYAMIGAGAVVKTDVSDYAVVVGVPAKQIAWACKCGTTLRFNNNYVSCGYCRSEYLLDEDRLIIIKEEI